MEDIHGVDVSWLHHTNRGLNKDAPASSIPARPTVELPKHHMGDEITPSTPQRFVANTLSASPNQHVPANIKKPSLLSRGSLEKLNQSSPGSGGRSIPRRNSWISNISSKFSSQLPQQQNGASAPSVASPSTQDGKSNAGAAAVKQTASVKQEELEPSVPQNPKAPNTSFFSNALRRLSSNTNVGGAGKVVGRSGLCPRMVLNIDRNRPRCLLPELDQAKLRRVAFCVDVEIAGVPRYKDEADGSEKKKKLKDKKLKERGEGEALKHPQKVADEKDETGVVNIENVGTEEDPDPEGTIGDADEKKDTSRKKEKKKRSEEERKERKEQKRRKAEESGAVPVQIVIEPDASPQTTPPASNTPRPTDRPTTDPLRIYRRCCQLRETPILKRISEQLQKPNACLAEAPGVVCVLDLTGSRLQFADIVTLSDWLAIVPVKKLVLEDSDLTDEGVRVILAGLLAAKSPDHVRRGTPNEKAEQKKCGVVEKLSLKNNTKISKEGWKHISLFIYMCKSLRALDISMISFPAARSRPNMDVYQESRPNHSDPAEIFSKALSERLGGDRFEELIMAECGLSSSDIRLIVDGVTVSGLKRLSLAGNHLDLKGFEHVLRYMRSGICQGIDIGSNDLRDHIDKLCEAIDEQCTVWALGLADCNLSPASLKPLFPELMKLPDLRFLDLSHNHDLFSKQPSALGLLRKYLSLLPNLKRLHLVDVSMSPAQAIALAEVLPECPSLAHLNILQNPQLSALASATDEETQEEACALYASLMAAARVSTALICVDIDVPTSDNSEVVKALAKQVIAYCLRNMEHFAALDSPDMGAAIGSALEGYDGIDVPDVLLHLVGDDEGHVDPHPEEPAPSNDYIVGGTGVVKALSYCLSEKASELRRGSDLTSGTTTPREHVANHNLGAKQMSKNLLESARKVRARLQPALVREAKAADDMAYRRLLFLDNTLQGMIQRFEDEYPECRVTPSIPIPATTAGAQEYEDAASTISSAPNSLNSPFSSSITTTDSMVNSMTFQGSDSEEELSTSLRKSHDPVRLSRHNSDVSLAARALSIEEGHVHRMGQKVKRDVLSTANGAVGVDEDPELEPVHMKVLRAKLEALKGEELRDSVISEGWEKAADSVSEKASVLRQLQRDNPEELRRLHERFVSQGDYAHETAVDN
ncbi:RNI-like protein [Tothia fuscella]|uniref:RNI-like protein n=1 Tax=Tothia fuscella TaxID=1048955 RepID=A0A9P4NW40_9PEZI|nr:RNI-like protein [Tothia fuscella]